MARGLTYFLMVLSISAAVHGRRLTAEQTSIPDLAQSFAAVATDNTVILTQTSCGYLEFAVNWITHVEALGVRNWLTICEDQMALDYLNTR